MKPVRLALAALCTLVFSVPVFASGWTYCVVGVHAPDGRPKIVLVSQIFEAGKAPDYRSQWSRHIVPVVRNSARQTGQALGKIDPKCQAVGHDFSEVKDGYGWFVNRMKRAGLLTQVTNWSPQAANRVSAGEDARAPKPSAPTAPTRPAAAPSAGLVIAPADKPRPIKDDRSNPSASLVRPEGTYLRHEALGGPPRKCMVASTNLHSAGPTHDGAEAEARMRALQPRCEPGRQFIAVGQPWCEQSRIGKMWKCYKRVRCDIRRGGCDPSRNPMAQ